MSWKMTVTALWLGLLGAACSQDATPETAIAISIKTDLGQELSSVRTRIYAVGVNPDSAPPMLDYPNQAATELARPTLVTKGALTEVLIVVQGLGADGTPLVVQRTRAQFIDKKTYNLPVFLGRACKAKNCGEVPGQTCYGSMQSGICEGTCGPIPVAESAGILDDEHSPLPTASWRPQICPMVRDSGPLPPDDRLLCDGGVGPSGCVVTDAGDAGWDAGDAGADAAICTPSVAGAPCNLVTQCGTCDPTTEACGIDESGTSRSIGCVIPGNEREGVTCQDASDCGRGLTCVDSICKRFCDTNKECGGSSKCAGVVAGTAETPLNFKVCGQSCTGHGDCSSGCCMESFCRASDKCPGSCKAAGATCTANADCCSSAPYCVAASSSATSGTCSATPPALVPTSCVASSADSACQSCNKSKCCTSYNACMSNTACKSLNACYGACATGDKTCLSNCDLANPSGVSAGDAWGQCLVTSCNTQCS